MSYRTTDWFVHDLIAAERDVSVWPLSVSSDRIAVCAWRCANLLTELDFPRFGGQGLISDLGRC